MHTALGIGAVLVAVLAIDITVFALFIWLADRTDSTMIPACPEPGDEGTEDERTY